MPPLTATTMEMKRTRNVSESENEMPPPKKQQMCFDDNVDHIRPLSQIDADDSSSNADVDFEHGIEFFLSFGDGLHEDEPDQIISQDHSSVAPKKTIHPKSPFADSDRCLGEELYFVDGDKNDESNGGPLLAISIQLCMRVPILPLITPPSSPRRIRTTMDGVTEEATICEWPSNLTVDTAITAALEASEGTSSPIET